MLTAYCSETQDVMQASQVWVQTGGNRKKNVCNTYVRIKTWGAGRSQPHTGSHPATAEEAHVMGYLSSHKSCHIHQEIQRLQIQRLHIQKYRGCTCTLNSTDPLKQTLLSTYPLLSTDFFHWSQQWKWPSCGGPYLLLHHYYSSSFQNIEVADPECWLYRDTFLHFESHPETTQAQKQLDWGRNIWGFKCLGINLGYKNEINIQNRTGTIRICL